MTKRKPAIPTGVPHSAWAPLYEQAKAVRQLAPWEAMGETELFALKDPDSGRVGFVSVMGRLGEHLSVAVYLGESALASFWRITQGFGDPEELLDTPHLQASWEDRDMLWAEDRALLKELGLKVRGRSAWPMFRSYRPGYAPWFLEAWEVSLLTHALGQLREVFPRRVEQPDLLEGAYEGAYLLRSADKQGGAWVWSDSVLQGVRGPDDGPPELSAAWQLDELTERRLRTFKHAAVALEIDVFPLPGYVRGERGARPERVYVLLVADSRSGMILHQMSPRSPPPIAEQANDLQREIASSLTRFGLLPKAILTRHHALHRALVPFCARLDIELHRLLQLPALDEAHEFLLGRL